MPKYKTNTLLSRERKASRVPVLLAARDKLAAKIEASPSHPRVEDYKARLAEYDTSLENIVKTGAETPILDE